MAKGKQTCKILKEIRKQIAAENDIELITSECTHQGDCLGTCPKCESEVRYLERELEKRQRMGKAAVIAGLSVSTLAAASCAGCGPVQPLAGMPVDAFDSSKVVCTDTTLEEPLAGDVEIIDPALQRPDTIPDSDIEEPLAGLVQMFQEQFTFDAEQYQKLMKEHFVFQDMDNLTIVDGVVFYRHAGPGTVCRTLEELVEGAKEFNAPHYSGGEKKMLEHIADKLKDKGVVADKFTGDMEVAFHVDPSGKLSDVEVVKGVDAKLDEAVAAVFSEMVWYPALYVMKDGSMGSSFECNCVQKIHFPITR